MSDQDKNGKPQRPSSATPDISNTTPDTKKIKSHFTDVLGFGL